MAAAETALSYQAVALLAILESGIMRNFARSPRKMHPNPLFFLLCGTKLDVLLTS